MQNASSYPVSPPEQRCIWMSAGVLTYQLCDRNFDCAQCPLDRVMRNMVKQGKHGDLRCVSIHLLPLRLGRYYTQEHCWIAIRSAETIRVGLEPNLAQRLRGLVGVSLPAVRGHVAARVPSAWCRFDQGMVPVRLPFPLQVTAVNADAGQNPRIVSEDPYDSGWLFDAKIDPAQLEACRVMSGWTAEKIYTDDEQTFAEAVRHAGGQAEKTEGVTAYDGGSVSAEALRELGSAQYCSLIARLYCKVS